MPVMLDMHVHPGGGWVTPRIRAVPLSSTVTKGGVELAKHERNVRYAAARVPPFGGASKSGRGWLDPALFQTKESWARPHNLPVQRAV